MPEINLLNLFKNSNFVITEVCGVSSERCKHTHSFIILSLQPILKSGAERIFRTKLLH